MDIRDLTYFSVSADAGNFGRAAKSLGLDTSTLSRRIARFEDELGLTLFERGHSGLRLTTGGKDIMRHVKRALAELDAIERSATENGSGQLGEIRLSVRMPPIGEPLTSLLSSWRQHHPGVLLSVTEMNDKSIAVALQHRQIDIALVTDFTSWQAAATLLLYRERLLAALPNDHPLATRDSLDWASLRDCVILVQEWDESQATREFYASLLGRGARFQAHSASKLSIFALVAAGFGITLATESQAQISFPGLIFVPIMEDNAYLQIELVWNPAVEDAAVGRFVAFLRDETRLKRLV